MHDCFSDQCIDKGFFDILLCHEKLAFVTNRAFLLFNRLNDTMAFTCPKVLYSLERITALTVQLLKELL